MAWKHGACVLPVRQERELRADMVRLGWPRLYVEEADWHECRVRAQALTWLASRGPFEGLMLHGPIGTGKTMTMCLVAKELWTRQGIVSRFISWPELVMRLATSDPGKGELLDRLKVAPFLCVDDVGVGDIAPWVFGTLDWLFEHRNGAGRPNMLTTNQTPHELRADAEWQRMVDRWRERMTRLVVGGPSQRTGP